MDMTFQSWKRGEEPGREKNPAVVECQKLIGISSEAEFEKVKLTQKAERLSKSNWIVAAELPDKSVIVEGRPVLDVGCIEDWKSILNPCLTQEWELK